MPWATPDDVIDRWIGDGAPTDTAQVGLWIADAETLIRFEYPDIDTRVPPWTSTGCGWSWCGW